jgi:tRNA (cytidine/uridine-2'-O-)-methyltransferase
LQETKGRRKLLLTTKSALPYTSISFRSDDILLLGRESSGVPEDVHNSADVRLTIPMQPGVRSLNVAIACAMVTGEALRQTAIG